ncbi:hypothetical protein HYV11_03350 [Candidatus Dependentiae bacterium]|nr:hypothetical protein [Candidatus Dependentiae bacterium]
MRFFNWRSILFFIASEQLFCSTSSMPINFDKEPSSEKKLHNTLTSSVKNNHNQPMQNQVIGNDSSTKNKYLITGESSHNTLASLSTNKDEKEESLLSLTNDHPSLSETKTISPISKNKSSPEQTAITLSENEKSKKEPGVLYQEEGFIDDHESIVFNFEETDLINVAFYMEKIHHIKFITEDILSTNKDAKGLSGHKLTFKTNKVLTKKESWDLFITFLHMAGLDIIPMSQAGFYKIVPFAKANGETVPTYIGVDVSMLPDNDMLVRYVYFARNIDPTKIQKILTPMQSGSAKLDIFSELRAFIFLDKASNIRTLMQIVTELDQSILPECLSVIKIKRANAEDIKTLYLGLRPNASSSQQPQKTWNFAKREPSVEYFPQDVSIFTDKRTNSLILLGSQKSIKKIEDFVEKYIDVDVHKNAPPPVFSYPLEYTQASDLASLLNHIVSYGSGTTAQEYGGVRNDIKYFSKMTILSEPHSNSLIINATKEDYDALVPLIKELDVPQKQIGLEVLMVQVSDSETKNIGSQISGPGGPNAGTPTNRGCQTFAKNISAQTSGIFGSSSSSSTSSTGSFESSAPVVSFLNDSNSNPIPGSYSIKASLAALLGSSLNGVINEAGAILVTFGKPIWALFKILQSMVSVHVVANPFVVVSNNTQAIVNIGEQRRITASEVVGPLGNSITGTQPLNATLGFTITPTINKSNIISLAIQVQNNQFTIAGSQTSAMQDQKSITTQAAVANGEVLVLGGIMQEQYNSASRGVPFLEHIPIIGWFFKSKSKSVVKSHFLVFICPRLLESVASEKSNGIDHYTKYKMIEAQKEIAIMDDLDWFASKRDPIQKKFFGDSMPTKLQNFAGQNVSLSKKRKQIQERKQNIISSNKKNKRPKTEKTSSFNQEPISFEQEFLNTQSSSLPKETKNSISKSTHKGDMHVA